MQSTTAACFSLIIGYGNLAFNQWKSGKDREFNVSLRVGPLIKIQIKKYINE